MEPAVWLVVVEQSQEDLVKFVGKEISRLKSSHGIRHPSFDVSEKVLDVPGYGILDQAHNLPFLVQMIDRGNNLLRLFQFDESGPERRKARYRQSRLSVKVRKRLSALDFRAQCIL